VTALVARSTARTVAESPVGTYAREPSRASAKPVGADVKWILETTLKLAASMTRRVPSTQANWHPATYSRRPSGLTAMPTGWMSRPWSPVMVLVAVLTTRRWSSLTVAFVTYAHRPSGLTVTAGVLIGRAIDPSGMLWARLLPCVLSTKRDTALKSVTYPRAPSRAR